jgi:hypothetical protein
VLASGISGVRTALEGIPGAENCLMRYEDGGAAQAFSIGDLVVRVGPAATCEEIRAAFVSEIEKRQNGGG